MIKKFKEFFTLKTNEDAVEIPTSIPIPTSISTEDLVRQLSDKLGIDINLFNMDDICDNIDVDGLSIGESKKVITKYLRKLNS